MIASRREMPAASRSATAARSVVVVGADRRRPRRRAGHHQGDLAARLALGGPVGQLAERPAAAPPRTSWSAPGRPRPAGRRRTSRPGRPAPRRSGAAPRRRPGCAPRRRARAAGSAGPTRRAGQEALEAEPVAGQPGQRQRGGDGARAGGGGDRHAGVQRGPDQPVAGVGDAGHAAVGDQRDRRARARARRPVRGCGAPRCPRSSETIRPATVTSRSRASRVSRRVSSAATTSAAARRLAQPGRGVGRVAQRRAEQDQAALTSDFHSRLPLLHRQPVPVIGTHGRRLGHLGSLRSPGDQCVDSAEPERRPARPATTSPGPDGDDPDRRGGGAGDRTAPAGAAATPGWTAGSWLATAGGGGDRRDPALGRNLGYPKGKIFDETTTPPTRQDLLVHGVEWNEKDNTPRTWCTRRWASG